MLEKLGFDSPESVKRFLVLLMGPLMAYMRSKLGWDIPDLVLAALMLPIATFIWQSGHKSAAIASAPQPQLTPADRIALARPVEQLK